MKFTSKANQKKKLTLKAFILDFWGMFNLRKYNLSSGQIAGICPPVRKNLLKLFSIM